MKIPLVPINRTLIWILVLLGLGALITVLLIGYYSQRPHQWVVLYGMEPPPTDGSDLSQADIEAIKAGLEQRKNDPTQAKWVDNSSWLDVYRYRQRAGDFGAGDWAAGTCDMNPSGISQAPPCHTIIWLKGLYGLYFYDAKTPDPEWQKQQPNATNYVELRKAEGDLSRVIFVVPSTGN